MFEHNPCTLLLPLSVLNVEEFIAKWTARHCREKRYVAGAFTIVNVALIMMVHKVHKFCFLF